MTADLRRLRSEALLLTAVGLLLAMAEDAWWYLAAILAGTAMAYWSLARKSKPLLSVQTGQVAALAAFGFLIVELTSFYWVPTVMKLSHFMILICIGKWLQPRTCRDDAMVLILLLLLLVVGAIVGGNLMFPAVLTLYMIVGYRLLVGHHLDQESARTRLRNAHIQGVEPAADSAAAASTPATTQISLATAIASLCVGAAVFVAIPRVGAGMFGQTPPPLAGGAISGFANSIEFNTIGQIQDSDKLVMRLVVTDEEGNPAGAGMHLYLRGEVLDEYRCRFPPWNRGWGWRRSNVTEGQATVYELVPSISDEPTASLLPEGSQVPNRPLLVQTFHLEPTDEITLFACYPPIEISSHDLKAVRKWTDTQILQTLRPARRTLKYVVSSPAISSSLASVLAAERPDKKPTAAKPDLSDEQRDRILTLIDAQTAGIGSLEEPENQLALVRRLEAFLQSSVFSYTKSPPPLAAQSDPVSDFLFNTKRGHCEYFASALALMCQIKGIPARVVVGYCADNYNSLGNFYLIRKKNAHAWVEVFIPGMDWVTVDPTPSSETKMGPLRLYRIKLSSYFDYVQFCWADMVLTFDSASRQRLFDQFSHWVRRPMGDRRTFIGGIVAFGRELFGWKLELTWKERLVYWVFTVLIAILTILLAYVAISVARWLGAAARRWSSAWALGQADRSRQVKFYVRFCQLLAGMNLHRQAGQTPAEFAEQLAARHPDLRDAPAIVQAYYEVAFGGRDLSPERSRFIEDFLSRLRSFAAQGRPSPSDG